MDKSFLYTVNPRKVITGLSGVNAIRTSKSLFLTKEDVKICLQKASVYRRFAQEGINERVTIGNIDRVHREHYISEEDWNKELDKSMSEGHGVVNAPVLDEKEESKQEEEQQNDNSTDVVSDDEEIINVEENPVEEIPSDEIVEENKNDNVDEKEVQTEPTYEEKQSDETTLETTKNNNAKQFNYGKKEKQNFSKK